MPHLAQKGVVMPLYEYTCGDCGHKFPMLRPIKERHDSIPCPKCGGDCSLCMSTCAVHMDYSSMDNFGDVRYAEARAKQCGVPT